jgi:signal transduction histidine kinase
MTNRTTSFEGSEIQSTKFQDREISPQMEFNKFSLAFPFASEKSFKTKYFHNSLIHFRVSFILVTFLYGIFGLLDQLVAKQFENLFHLIRYQVVIPLLILVFLFSFSKYFIRIWQELIFICVIIGGAGIAVMIIKAPENTIYFAGLMLIFSAGYFFIKLRFLMATIAGWVVLLFFNVGVVFFSDVESKLIISYNFFFVSANLIGMLGAYYIEFYTRKDFFLNEQLDLRNAIIEESNKNLESKVAKRTEELLVAKNQAEQSDKLKSTFLANMSHEIRTPLNSIIGFAELVVDPYFSPEQHTEFAQLISNNGNSLLSVISNIMDISKIEAGQLVLRRRRFSLNKLIGSILKEFSLIAIKKGIELRDGYSEQMDEIIIETDEAKLRQILVNLIENAIKFTESGYVEIGIQETENSLLFFVKDTGIGISEENRNTIFERFRQVETAFTRKYGGNGLGLAISKSLVEFLGGTVWLESEEGKGSKFSFTIPKV